MKTRSYRGRTVHLVDLENLAGSGHVTESHARWVRDVYLATGVVSKGDHVILGVSHHKSCWPPDWAGLTRRWWCFRDPTAPTWPYRR